MNIETLIEDGRLIVKVNLIQKIHLLLLSKFSAFLQRKRIPRESGIGRYVWRVFEIHKAIVGLISPKAMDVFWFWIEARWALETMSKQRVSFNKYEYTFVRKKRLSPRDIRMTLKSYKAINETRKYK